MMKYLGMVVGMMAGVTLTLVASPALAHTDVDVRIGVPGPVYAQPAPVYVQPRPVYVQPRTVYVQPQPVYVQPRAIRYERHDRRDWHDHRAHGWRDQDRDGIANRFDRDRDGDGVPNRWDRHPQNPYRY